MQHVVVDCMIHKAHDGFAGLRRPDAATRSWLKDLNIEIGRTANDYIYNSAAPGFLPEWRQDVPGAERVHEGSQRTTRLGGSGWTA